MTCNYAIMHIPCAPVFQKKEIKYMYIVVVCPSVLSEISSSLWLVIWKKSCLCTYPVPLSFKKKKSNICTLWWCAPVFWVKSLAAFGLSFERSLAYCLTDEIRYISILHACPYALMAKSDISKMCHCIWSFWAPLLICQNCSVLDRVPQGKIPLYLKFATVPDLGEPYRLFTKFAVLACWPMCLGPRGTV